MENLTVATKEQKEKYIQFFGDLCNEMDVDFNNYLDVDKHRTYDDIQDALNDECAFDIEIIYYYVAIEYLKENDPSLQISLGLAADYEFETKDLNSEKLASLLASDKAQTDFYEKKEEIEEFLNELFK